MNYGSGSLFPEWRCNACSNRRFQVRSWALNPGASKYTYSPSRSHAFPAFSRMYAKLRARYPIRFAAVSLFKSTRDRADPRDGRNERCVERECPTSFYFASIRVECEPGSLRLGPEIRLTRFHRCIASKHRQCLRCMQNKHFARSIRCRNLTRSDAARSTMKRGDLSKQARSAANNGIARQG